jgi:hypothetical protein
MVCNRKPQGLSGKLAHKLRGVFGAKQFNQAGKK